MTTQKENIWVNRWFNIIVTIAMGVSCYFLNETVTSIKSLDIRVSAIELNNASFNGNKFTAADWSIQRALIDADKLTTEKRITVLESTIPQIKESLIRIENAVEKQNQKFNN